MHANYNVQRGLWISMISYLILAVSKIGIGLWADSLAVFADSLNNVSDIFISVALLIGVKVASRPADHDHPFGHNRAESVATLIAASGMVLVSLHIWIDVIKVFFNPQSILIHPLALYISILSAAVMFCVSLFNFYLSKKTNSTALRAAALDNRADALVSMGAAIGILGNAWGIAWLDPLTAFIVGGIILKTAIELGYPVIHSLMDGFDQTQLTHIKQIIYSVDGIDEVRELRARNHGVFILIEVTVGVPSHLSVLQSHKLTEEIESRLIGYQNIQHVHVHVEPVV